MYKRWTALFVGFLLLFGLTACRGTQQAGADSGKVQVVVSFNAMGEIAAAVGGDRIELTTIIPDGSEPHDFEPKAQDLTALGAAQVFVMNGLGMEPWAGDAVSAVGNDSLIVVTASDGYSLLPVSDESEADGQYDPHVWLSLKGAEAEAKNIRDALVRADPAHAADYEANCTSFMTQLQALYTEYAAKFASVEKKDFVTGHAAFAYLCRDFGLRQTSVENVFAEGEPSAGRLTELISFCKANQVKTVFVEEMVSPEISATLAEEVGATLKTIDTLEGGKDGLTYLDRMKDNLSLIYDSLAQ